MTRRALIIGAGPGGLSAAIALRRIGMQVQVFERASELREIGQGLGLQSNAIRALSRLGVAEPLIEAGDVIEWQEFFTSEGRPLARLPQAEVARRVGSPTVSLLRRDLQRVLRDAVGDADITLDSTCVSFSEEDDSVTARFSDGREEHGAVLIGADGIHSTVRQAVVGETPLRDSGFTSWRGVASPDHELFPPTCLRQFVGRGAMFSMFPVGKGRVYWGAVSTGANGKEEPPEGRKQEVRSLFRDFVSPVAELIAQSPESEMLRGPIQDRDPVPRWRKGRTILIGDAAHSTTPFLGQGAGLAIEDAVVLARELALADIGDALEVDAAFRSFEAKRMDRTAQITLKSRQRATQFAWNHPLKCLVRDTVFRMTPARTWRSRLEESLGYEV